MDTTGYLLTEEVEASLALLELTAHILHPKMVPVCEMHYLGGALQIYLVFKFYIWAWNFLHMAACNNIPAVWISHDSRKNRRFVTDVSFCNFREAAWLKVWHWGIFFSFLGPFICFWYCLNLFISTYEGETAQVKEEREKRGIQSKK